MFALKPEHGDRIPIEQQDRNEVAQPHGVGIVAKAAKVMNSAFDSTPAQHAFEIAGELATREIVRTVVLQSPPRKDIDSHVLLHRRQIAINRFSGQVRVPFEFIGLANLRLTDRCDKLPLTSTAQPNRISPFFKSIHR
ncbi:MAG: hypothetical protein AB8B91_09910 [Rubripirellula sp.]